MKRFHSDRGGEYVDKKFNLDLQEQGIKHEYSVAYAHEQNGFIERDNIIIMEATRNILHARGLPKFLRAEAVNIVVHVLNRTTTRALSGSMPYEQWSGRQPDISYFPVFGCFAFKHMLKELRTKLEPKAQRMVFVRYAEDSKGYRLWNPSGRKISIASDVEFDESTSTNELTQIEVYNDPQQYLHVTVGVGEQVIQRIVQIVAHEVSPPFAGDADIPSSDAVRSSNHSRGMSRARDATSQVVVSEHEISELGLDSGTMDAELQAGLDNSSNIENIPIQSPQRAQRAPERYGEYG